MSSIRIEEIYQEILDGKRKNFPKFTWSDDIDRQNARRVTKYLIEKVLMWDITEVKKSLSCEIFYKYRLRGMLLVVYRLSPFFAINDAYPGVLSEWDMPKLPNNFWTKERALERLEHYIKQTELPLDQFLHIYDLQWIQKNGLHTVLIRYWDNSPFKMIKALYPEIKEYDMKLVPKGHWDDPQTALHYLKELLEEKYCYSTEEIYEFVSYKWVKQNGLQRPLNLHWNNSIINMINVLYPNRFINWYFKTKPRGYWTKEMSIHALKYTIEEIEKIKLDELNKVCTIKWLKRHNLYFPCRKFWKSSITQMLTEIYPELYRKK